MGGASRSSAGQHVDIIEIFKRSRYRQNDTNLNNRPQKRQGDGAEPLESICSVDFSRIIIFLADSLKAGEQNNNIHAKPLPDGNRNCGIESCSLFSQPDMYQTIQPCGAKQIID